MSLLDYAESTLNCNKVYCIISCLVPDEQRKVILKSFRFMDFQILPPGVPVLCPGYIFICYSIDSSGSSDDEN